MPPFTGPPRGQNTTPCPDVTRCSGGEEKCQGLEGQLPSTSPANSADTNELWGEMGGDRQNPAENCRKPYPNPNYEVKKTKGKKYPSCEKIQRKWSPQPRTNPPRRLRPSGLFTGVMLNPRNRITGVRPRIGSIFIDVHRESDYCSRG